jgi:hypothetical protein
MKKQTPAFSLIGLVLTLSTATAQVPMKPQLAVSACRQKQQNDVCGFYAPFRVIAGVSEASKWPAFHPMQGGL